jgi:hypothetical protein
MRVPPAPGQGQAVRKQDVEESRLDAAESTSPRRPNQVLDDLGHRLSPRRDEQIVGAARRAVPGWYALAVDRWSA